MFQESSQNFQELKIGSGIYLELPTKRNKSGGHSTINVPIPKKGETLEYKTLTDPQYIEKEILWRNIRHFKQAENTPLAEKKVINSIEFGATTSTTDEILKGIVDINAITDDPTG